MLLYDYLKKCMKDPEFREIWIEDTGLDEEALGLNEELENKKQLKESKQVKTFEEKAQALLDYLAEEDLTLEDVREGYDEDTIEFEDGREYLVCDADTAHDLAVEDIKNFIDDLGIEGFTPRFKDWVYNNAVDEEEFKNIFEEDLNSYYGELDLEELVDEALNFDLVKEDDVYEEVETDFGTDRVVKDGLDEDELKEKIVEYRVSEDDPVEYFKGMFGKNDYSKFLNENNLIDFDAVAEEAIKWDGVAHFLAGYDGEELDLGDDLYAYRTN